MDETGNKKVNTDQRKQQLKKYGFYALLCVIFTGAMWIIFRPSSTGEKKEKEGTGFNTELPDPKNRGIIGDKAKAYEMDGQREQKQEKRKSLADFVSLIGGNSSADAVLTEDEPERPSTVQVKTAPPASVKNSASAYREINRTLEHWNDGPPATGADEQAELALQWRIQELERKLEEQETKKHAEDEQLALIEKSYELANRYMSNNPTATQEAVDIELEAGTKQTESASGRGKNTTSPVKQVREQTVSALAQDIPDAEFIESFNRPRNTGFLTPDAGMGVNERNTISAVVHDNHTLINGQSVRLRLTEPMAAGGRVIPSNTLLTGIAALQGERLHIFISSIEHGGAIIPVEITAFDYDGQEGIYVPGTLELDAAKEIAANMGNAVGTSFTLTQNAGQQIASDLTKGAMQGVSQYMNKKIRQVKVTLKGGYRLLLLPKQQ
jgi:conjugative transposon TraM protein